MSHAIRVIISNPITFGSHLPHPQSERFRWHKCTLFQARVTWWVCDMCSHTVTLTCSPMEFINIVSHTFCSISGLPEASEHLTERKREAKAFLLDCLSTTYLLSDCQCFFSRISLPLVPSAPLLSAIHPAMDKRWPDVLSITGIFVLK